MGKRQGFILCVHHARQWARDEEFSGPCSPSPEWKGGHGQIVRCDAADLGEDD